MSAKKIIDLIKQKKSFLITSHVNPDPDALCSELALAIALKSLGKTVHIVNEDVLPRRFHVFPKAHLVKKFSVKKKIVYDAAIILDCGDLDRIGQVKKCLDPQKPIVNIDHHITNDSFGSLNFIKPKASSTAEILFDLLGQAKCSLTREIAILLYLGIMTDTGSFRYDNTTPHTHAVVGRLMQFKFSVSELYKQLYESIPFNDLKIFTKIINSLDVLHFGKTVVVELRKSLLVKFSADFDLREKIFTFLRSIKGVEVLVIFTEFEKNKTRVNFRSQGKVNVARLARFFQGGGHKKASGCMIDENLSKAKKKILSQLKDLV